MTLFCYIAENSNTLHMGTAQSATNCNTIITIAAQCIVRSDIDDTSVGIIRNGNEGCVCNVISIVLV